MTRTTLGPCETVDDKWIRIPLSRGAFAMIDISMSEIATVKWHFPRAAYGAGDWT